MIFGVEHIVLDLFLGQEFRKGLGRLDARRTNQHRGALVAELYDILHYSLELLLGSQIDQVVGIDTDHRLIGGNDHHVETVDLVKLESFSIRRTGHAGELFIQAEIILKGGGCQCLAFVLNGHAFLCLDGLVQAFG